MDHIVGACWWVILTLQASDQFGFGPKPFQTQKNSQYFQAQLSLHASVDELYVG